MYAGSTADTLAYFTNFGFNVPTNSNPADALMDVIAAADKRSNALPEDALPQKDTRTTEGLVALWREHGPAMLGGADAAGHRPEKRRTMHSFMATIVFFVRASVQLQRRLMNTVLTYVLILVGVVLLCVAFDKCVPQT